MDTKWQITQAEKSEARWRSDSKYLKDTNNSVKWKFVGEITAICGLRSALCESLTYIKHL
jgi:hypothetical protein